MRIKLNLYSLLIVFLAICCKSQFLSNNEHLSREFFEAFLKSTIGSEKLLDKDCLSGKFDEYYKEFNKSILIKDIVGISFYLNMMVHLEIEKCPLDDLKMLYKEFRTSWKNGNTWENIMKHSDIMKSKIQEFVSHKSKTPTDIGLFAGYMYKVLVYGLSQD